MNEHWSTSPQMQVAKQEIARALLKSGRAVLQQSEVSWEQADRGTQDGLEHIAESMLIRAGWLLSDRERRRPSSALALTNTSDPDPRD